MRKFLCYSVRARKRRLKFFVEQPALFFLSGPISKTQTEVEQELDYFDSKSRMFMDRENFRYRGFHVSKYAELQLEKFRVTLKEVEKAALKQGEGPLLYGLNARPFAISFSRYHCFGQSARTEDVVHLKIMNAIASSLECYQLLSAAYNGNNQALRSILDRGVNVNLQDRTGNTALHLAATTGRIEIVKLLLLQHEANVALQNSKCRSALFMAVGSGKNEAEIVALLLKKGARVKDKDKDGSTPLMLSN